MQIELSPEALERVENLVDSGAFPSAAAVLDAALDALEMPAGYTDAELAAIAESARRSVADGHVRNGWEVAEELRALVSRKQGSAAKR